MQPDREPGCAAYVCAVKCRPTTEADGRQSVNIWNHASLPVQSALCPKECSGDGGACIKVGQLSRSGDCSTCPHVPPRSLHVHSHCLAHYRMPCRCPVHHTRTRTRHCAQGHPEEPWDRDPPHCECHKGYTGHDCSINDDSLCPNRCAGGGW